MRIVKKFPDPQPVPSVGRYEIVRLLGEGSYGAVYLALDPLIGRPVAIKSIPRPEGRRAAAGGGSAGDAEPAEDREAEALRQQLLHEARSVGTLSHPGIVTVHDVLEEADGGISIAMEFVAGESLRERLASPEPISFELVADLVRQVAAALDYAHAHGVVHRDLKPANLLLDADSRVKIVDFGIASARQRPDQSVFEGHGTPGYLSPERLRGEPTDHRADVWSLGVLLYELLTRQRPFRGETLAELARNIVERPFLPPETFRPDLPPGIKAILARALDKDPDGRYQSAGELASDLAAVVASQARLSDTKPLPELTEDAVASDAAEVGAAPPEPGLEPSFETVVSSGEKAEGLDTLAQEAAAEVATPADEPLAEPATLATEEAPPGEPADSPAAPVESPAPAELRLRDHASALAIGLALAALRQARRLAAALWRLVRRLAAWVLRTIAGLPPVVRARVRLRLARRATERRLRPVTRALRWLAARLPELRRPRVAWAALAGALALAVAVLAFAARDAGQSPRAAPAAAAGSEPAMAGVAAALLRQAEGLTARGQQDAAAELLREAETIAPHGARFRRLALRSRWRDAAIDRSLRRAEPARLLAEARDALAGGRLAEAESAVAAALRLDPARAEARNLAANLSARRRAAARASAVLATPPVVEAIPPEPQPLPLAPPEPAVVEPEATPASPFGTLRIELDSELSRGVLTLYRGAEHLYRREFHFTVKRGFLRRKGVSGSFSDAIEIDAGEVPLRIYLSAGDRPATLIERTIELTGGGERTLSVRVDETGGVTAALD